MDWKIMLDKRNFVIPRSHRQDWRCTAACGTFQVFKNHDCGRRTLRRAQGLWRILRQKRKTKHKYKEWNETP